MSRRARRSRRQSAAPFSLFAFQDIIAAVTGVMILATMLLMLELLTQSFAVAGSVTDETQPSEAQQEIAQLEAQRDRLLEQITKNLTNDDMGIVTQAQVAALESMRDERSQLAEELARQLLDTQDQLRELKRTQQSQADALVTMAREINEAELELASALSRTPVTLLEGTRQEKNVWFLACDAGLAGIATINTRSELVGQKELPRDPAGVLNWATQRSPATDRFVVLVGPGGVQQFDRWQQTLRSRGFDLGWDLLTPSLADAFRVPAVEVTP